MVTCDVSDVEDILRASTVLNAEPQAAQGDCDGLVCTHVCRDEDSTKEVQSRTLSLPTAKVEIQEFSRLVEGSPGAQSPAGLACRDARGGVLAPLQKLWYRQHWLRSVRRHLLDIRSAITEHVVALRWLEEGLFSRPLDFTFSFQVSRRCQGCGLAKKQWFFQRRIPTSFSEVPEPPAHQS